MRRPYTVGVAVAAAHRVAGGGRGYCAIPAEDQAVIVSNEHPSTGVSQFGRAMTPG